MNVVCGEPATHPIKSSAAAAPEAAVAAADEASAEHVRMLINDCKKLLMEDPDAVLGAWGLIDNDPVTGRNA